MTKMIKDIMTSSVETIGPHSTLREAAQKMKDLNVGALPVCDNDRLVGMVTDRDIVVRTLDKGFSPDSAYVRDAMTKGITYCFEDNSIEDAAELMQDKQIRRLAVLNRNKRLTGILSLGDLALESPSAKLAGKTIREVSKYGKEEQGRSNTFRIVTSAIGTLLIAGGAAYAFSRYGKAALEKREHAA